MPKIVDHEARRALVAETAVRIIGTRGIEAASVRVVAAEAGVSAGAVQRCFATRQELLRFVLHHLNARFTARVLARMARTPDPADQAVGLRMIIDEMLPLDDERRLTSAATTALLAYSATEPAAADIMRAAYAGAYTFFERAFDREAAITLYALVSGLQGPLLVGAVTPAQAWSIVDSAVSSARSTTPR
ncbi:TetR/AcrR family transcriptional regulator [Catellatospora sp. KI3]|uniref:TetR/AcrR family transcriptional regulator n=1 Tax=Catellatospora sp. KI3 TaxID=3041620 RepID=UPI0024830F5C|nr:TetR/AcrR family transcriptional regulator [Catellatospora sp. KI3]MDI1463117.1 TetR/AcrR family transcriptional regulator [Catellatospora sp. KI3]